MDHKFACPKPTHMCPIETRPFMFQHLFAGHAGPVINKMAPCGYRGPAANSRSKDNRKTNPRSVYRRSKGWPVEVTGVGLPDSQEGGFMRKHCKSYQLTLPQAGGGRAMWEQAGIVFAGQIYCSYPPDCAIIQQSVQQITLGSVSAPCIRFTALYIHRLSRVKNSGLVIIGLCECR